MDDEKVLELLTDSGNVIQHYYTELYTFKPTPVFLPGESQRPRGLVGCHLWGHTESDTPEAT